MNLLYRGGSSENGFQSKLLENLRKDGVFSQCTVLLQSLDKSDVFPDEGYNVMDATAFYFGRYDSVCDIADLPSVPLDIWEGLRCFKDDIINMSMRPFNSHLYNYFEMDRLYSQAVRFWNYILDRDEINMFFSIVSPHTVWEMVIYSLCKVKDIPVLIVDEHWIPGHGTIFTDISHNGINVKKCFDLHKDETIECVEPMQQWFDNCVKTRLSYNKKSKRANMIDNRNIDRDLYYSTFGRDFYYMTMQYARRLIKGKSVQSDVDFFKELTHRRHQARKIRNHDKDIFWYDRKYAKDPVEGEPYILYLLQYMPEATLLPKSGVCSNQIIAARILAKGAEKAGVKLYVKEHYSQCPRDDVFYEELMSIPNLRLIKLDEPTGPLQDKSIATASQTGTCLLESMAKGKPYMSMAYNPVAEGPGGFIIRSEEDVYNAIKSIQSGFSVDEKAIKNYYGALCKTSVRCYLDSERIRVFTFEQVAEDLKNLIKSFVDSGMPDDFYFERENYS